MKSLSQRCSPRDLPWIRHLGSCISGLLIISAKQMDQPLEIQLPSHVSQTLTSEPEKIAKAQSPVKPVLINLCAESVSSMQARVSIISKSFNSIQKWHPPNLIC